MGGPSGFIIPINIATTRLIRTTNNFARPPTGTVYKNPVVNFTVPALSIPMAGAYSNLIFLTGSRIIRFRAGPYVGYKQYMRIYPLELVPTRVDGTIRTRSVSRTRHFGINVYFRYNTYTCSYPTRHPLIRRGHHTGTVLTTHGTTTGG